MTVASIDWNKAEPTVSVQWLTKKKKGKKENQKVVQPFCGKRKKSLEEWN